MAVLILSYIADLTNIAKLIQHEINFKFPKDKKEEKKKQTTIEPENWRQSNLEGLIVGLGKANLRDHFPHNTKLHKENN